ncbi:hypothetical protein QUO16_004628 [Vibrio parahaemolyticus]|uniref:hypothetical protein n=1 Tax=Vibrio parahaemolyticus TaxID=670 RepID=UPI000A3C6293|nr:hypothetical protein [Vibrio parahaemolyticus]ELA9373301.1 hypothetical protein [Vibrio parahaemolyticus]OUJ46556.1 hypothetical protein BTM22_25215 [Vibrio parahaemolyticus]TOE56151.1 hypothetical protein CGJ40_24035 [Vibrio parahaemolyticus]HCG8707560.1 hypothetical protein [Vibrio parahaemolyticus]
MSFEYNENTCSEIIKFYSGKIQEISRDIEDLSSKIDTQTDQVVVDAMNEYCNDRKQEIQKYQSRIEKFKGMLGSQ